MLSDGRALFACGSKAEVYDPASGVFTQVTDTFNHSYDVAVLLADGRVLLAGGYGAACQIYDPATNLLSPTGEMASPVRHDVAAALMADGTVLVAGGGDGTTTLDSVESWDPDTGVWTARPPLLQRREGARVLPLPTGDALVVGGKYRLSANSWSAIPYDRQAELIAVTCVPTTCPAAGATCGALPDGCGGSLDCGSCSVGEVCSANACCSPTTCAAAGATCGALPDGCGGSLDCGSCSVGEVCSGNACCSPTTCAAAGATCGSLSDGCGGTLGCGSCGAGETCSGNICACAPTTCAAQGTSCGIIPDGCGGTLTCDECPQGLACDLVTAACKQPPGQAVYDASLKAPACVGEASICDSGTLLMGRAQLGPESNAPNTLGGSCADGTSGSFHNDESLDRLSVSTLDGGPLTAGATVRVEAMVWAFSGYSSDRLDLFYAADALNPAWVLINTLTPGRAGAQVLSTTYTLPSGERQAIRGVFRYNGSASPCGTGVYDDRDDLVFQVIQRPDAAPPDVALTAPAAGATVAGDVTVSATASDDVGVTRVEFWIAPNVAGSTAALLGSDSIAPYSVLWNTRATTPATSHVLTAKAFDAVANVTTRSQVVVVDNLAPTVTLTSPTSGETVSGTVTVSADAVDYSGVKEVALFADDQLLATVSAVPFQASWNAAASTPGVHTLQAVATDNLGNTASASVTVMVTGTPGTAVYAVYSPTWRAPACETVGASCGSGDTLLRGRATLGPEQNAPNTLGGTCFDGTSGTFHSDESIDQLQVATVDGGPLRAGAVARVTAVVWAFSTSDVFDVFSAPSASSPVWTYVGTASPTASGAQTLTVAFTLPTGNTQALRGVFRWGGTRSACPTGVYDDKDDLVFAAE
jgi:hypothetical protein